jgi:hypothetical protein
MTWTDSTQRIDKAGSKVMFSQSFETAIVSLPIVILDFLLIDISYWY